MRVRILGAGVVGLTTAIALTREGFNVELVADLHGAATASSIAAAVWHIFLVEPDARLETWGRETVAKLGELTGTPHSGVIMRRGVEYLRNPPPNRETPSWASLVPHFAWLEANELPQGVKAAYEVEAPLADMSLYLPYLVSLVESGAQKVESRRYGSLDEAAVGTDVLVNCTGFASRELAQDPNVFPTWGQVVYVVKPEGLDYYIGDDENPQGMAYVLPRVNDVVLGGAAEVGREGDEVEDAVTESIIDRCVALEPKLEGAPVLAVKAGMRPCRRGGIRVELDAVRVDVAIIHNYGHGGSGFSLSWGCAAEIGRIIKTL